MRRLWPHDRYTITPCDHKEPFSFSRCSVVCRHELSELYLIPQLIELLYKLPECISLLCPYRMMSSVERSPCLELFDILKHNHSRSHKCRPSACYPCKASDVLILWFSTLGLTEMLAVRREPGKGYRMPLTGFHRINRPHVLTVVLCVWMIDLMHPDGFRVMVDSYINAVPCSHLNSC